MSLTIAKAELTGVFLESISYGVYISIFIQCLHALRRRPSRSSDYLLGTAVSLFILTTVHLVIDIMRNMDAFTTNVDTPDYANTYYENYDTWKDILKSGLYVAVTLISDAFIMYRSFLVWGRNYVVAALPFLMFLADIAIGILWVYTISLVAPGGNVYTDLLSLRLKAFYSITLAMNVICTCLIAFKVRRIQRAVAPYIKGNHSELSRVVAIIVESGSAYSVMLVIMIATYSSGSPAMFIFLNTMSPIIGIVFSSVIVRVGLGLSHGDEHTTTRSLRTNDRWGVRVVGSAGRINSPEGPFGTSSSMGSFSGGGVQVALEHTVHTHIDGPPVTRKDSGYPEVRDGFGLRARDADVDADLKRDLSFRAV